MYLIHLSTIILKIILYFKTLEYKNHIISYHKGVQLPLNMEMKKQKTMSRAIFIESLIGNIKEKYFFEKKLGSGGYGAVYLAKNKQSGKL